MHQGEQQRGQEDAELLLVFHMQQGFYALLDHSTGEKFLDKCSEDINVCTLQRATDKVALDLYAGKRQDKLCKDDHQTGDHAGGKRLFEIGTESGDVWDQTDLP